MSMIALLNCHGDDVFCFRKEIIEALVNNGFKVLLSCPNSRRLDIFRNNENILIEDISIDRRGTNPFKDLKLLVDYIKLFKKHRPEIVCNFTIKPNIYGSIAADIMRIPHINNITGLGSGFQNGGFIQKVVKLLYKIALRNSQKVFFQNEENQNIALNVGLINNQTPYEIIPGSGVNLDRFEYKPIDQNKKEIVFNYIGRVLKDKRVDDFIDAAKIIKSKYNNVRFNIIGFIEPTEIHYKNLLKNLEDKGIIHYLGSVDDVRSLVYASDAIIHPSSYGEGISNVLLESAACGRAIITTDIAGCKDCVDDYVTGYVYHAEDVSQLVSKIECFLHLSKEQRIKMGLLGRIKVEEQFDRRIVVDKYLKEVGV